ncbi:MAG: hypothetical protein H7099_12995 [Gemmatimonadaceae bacterium]|nr:hypothetical protein [Gemmatimonadaceae bacterium]
MFHLRALGGLWLEDGAGSPVELRSRWLALLAMVAAGERGGASRDHTLGILWPELDQSRASHALSQVLYSVRRVVGADLIAATARVLRLDASIIRSDIDQFQAAVGDRADADVVRLYRGTFLSGFYLENAPEFERWTAETRTRLARDAETAIERHAEHCDRTGQTSDSRAAWRRLSEFDPLNSRFAYEYVLALAKSGDRGGAVRHGQSHVALLMEELGSAPPTRLTDLLARLQGGSFVSTRHDNSSATH